MTGKLRTLAEERHHVALRVKATAPARLDQYLLAALGWRSRTRLQELIREGHVTVNGEVTKPSRRVRGGDAIEMRLSRGVGIPGDYEERRFDILYEDEWLVAINKPAGMLVHPVGRHLYDTVMNYLHHRYHHSGSPQHRTVPRLCHRIDRETTGVLVVAKDEYAHREVMYQFEHREVHKEYAALVQGEFPDDVQNIDRAIGEGRCLRTALEHPVLKASRTVIRVEQRFREHTLLRCVPETGRQNQIRLHLAAAGFPLLGDTRFGGASSPKGFPERFLLHAAHLELRHPRLKCRLEIDAPLPPDFQSLIERLDKRE